MKRGRQSSNVEDRRGGQSTWESAKAILTLQKDNFLMDVGMYAPSAPIQELSRNFTKSANPAGTPMSENAPFHAELRKGF